jgi:hypothetical protein
MPHIPAALGLDVPNLLPESVLGANLDWARPAGRLIWSTLITVVAVVVILAVTRRPKSPEPVTWAGAMAGAVGVFALFILGFAVVPHEWLTFANSYLNWGKDSFFMQRNSVVPFDITMRVIADTIEVLIYVVATAASVFLFVKWQKRPVREPAATAGAEAARTPTRTSAYGRPVTAS